MNIFCRLFGHTWVPVTDNPKISWNAKDDGQVLHASPAGETRFFDECVRCRERREVIPMRRFGGSKPAEAARS
ncbi:MAG: hypothetical protein FJ294_01410 [Planctomycetes bacterium]|nr:hypothetical protein [Planctomycetota bacterium]